jgi:hypothetical protein
MTPKLNPDFAEMLSVLSAEGVEFLVVGAFALAAHGNPRATGDIDLWVRPHPANARRVIVALRNFGAPLFDLTLDDLLKNDTVFQIGIPPARIDILTGVSGLTFEEAWSRKLEVNLEGKTVSVLSLQDLATNKAAAGRDKDLADLVWLRKHGAT